MSHDPSFPSPPAYEKYELEKCSFQKFVMILIYLIAITNHLTRLWIEFWMCRKGRT